LPDESIARATQQPEGQRYELADDAWQNRRNKNHAKADWQFTNRRRRVKLKRLHPTL
jgi:hypothetical protein